MNTDSREEGGRTYEIPITFGPIHAAFEPYFAASLSIVVYVNLLNLHNEKRSESRGETRLNSTEYMGNSYATKHPKATLSNLPGKVYVFVSFAGLKYPTMFKLQTGRVPQFSLMFNKKTLS